MKRQKDDKGIDFPIIGICMGFEQIHYLANDDDKDTLSDLLIQAESRKIDFTVHNPTDYSLFRHFNEDLLEALELEDLSLHSHRWVIKTDTYRQSTLLEDFFDILAVDEFEGDEFVVAVEGKHYPVTGVMFHPETQNRHGIFIDGEPDGSIKGKINNEKTDAINYHFSEHVHARGMMTIESHKFADP